MLSFLHPYVAVIIDFIESIDDFMEKNGGEFNSYVLSIMLIVIGYAKFIQKAKKAKGLNQKTQGKLELFAGVNLLSPSKMQTEIGCAIVFFVLGQQIFTKTKEAKAEVLMSFFAKQIFRETWMRNNNRTSLTFLPNNVNEYGPVNVMYFAIFIGMISGAYLLAKAPATARRCCCPPESAIGSRSAVTRKPVNASISVVRDAMVSASHPSELGPKPTSSATEPANN